MDTPKFDPSILLCNPLAANIGRSNERGPLNASHVAAPRSWGEVLNGKARNEGTRDAFRFRLNTLATLDMIQDTAHSR